MKKLNTLHGLFAASLLLAGTASAQIVEDFESGNPDSWQIDFNGTINGFPISAITGTVGGGGNPGNAIGFNAVSEQIGPWFFNSPASSNFSGDLRAKGVTGIACDMNFTTVASSPFGSVFVAMIADDNGTPEVLDDLFCWYYDFSYAYNGFGPGQLPSGTWNHCTWNLDTSSTTLPAGWTINNIAGNFAGDPDTAWNALVTDVDYVAFANGAPWSPRHTVSATAAASPLPAPTPAPPATAAPTARALRVPTSALPATPAPVPAPSSCPARARPRVSPASSSRVTSRTTAAWVCSSVTVCAALAAP
jgi:hypothetical protein